MQTLNTVGSFLKSKMKEKMREDSVATSHCVFFLSKANLSTNVRIGVLCDSPHVHNEVDNVW